MYLYNDSLKSLLSGLLSLLRDNVDEMFVSIGPVTKGFCDDNVL